MRILFKFCNKPFFIGEKYYDVEISIVDLFELNIS